MATIQELARTVGFRGGAGHKIAEPSQIATLPVIDNAIPTKQAVRTSVDCYVSGQYTQKDGKVMEVTQRYSIFVSYSNSTQVQTMTQVRDRVLQDFESKYGKTFNVSNVFVPTLPNVRDEAQPMEMYGGTQLYRKESLPKYEKYRYDIGTEKAKTRINIRSIKSRYNYKR